MTMSSSAISCSRSISPSAGTISVRRSSREPRPDLRQLFPDQRHQPRLVGQDRAQLGDPLDQVGVLVLDRLRSSPVSARRRMSRIAWAWISVSPNGSISSERAASASSDAADQRDHLVEVVERDQVALEHVRPALGPVELELGAPGDDLASGGRGSAPSICRSDSVRGFTPSTSATMLTPNVVCSGVCLYSLFSTTLGIASRFSSIVDAACRCGRTRR